VTVRLAIHQINPEQPSLVGMSKISPGIHPKSAVSFPHWPKNLAAASIACRHCVSVTVAGF
jgi:hypothetical protein